jgi:hypothetical protein
VKEDPVGDYFAELVQAANSSETTRPLKLQELLYNGLGNQVGLHVYDQALMFDMNWAKLFGDLLGAGSAGNDAASSAFMLMYGFYGSSLLAPAYLAVPVRDPQVVDEFLERLDKLLPTLGPQLLSADPKQDTIKLDYYKLTVTGDMKVRAFGVRYGPVRFRLFWSRIGNGLYLTNQPSVLEDLRLAATAQAKAVAAAQPIDQGPSGHALVRLRPLHWNQALAGFRLGWAENNREACLHNLGPLSSAARAFTAAELLPETRSLSWDDRWRRHAEAMYGSQFFCPEGGRYLLSQGGKAVTCSLHGSALDPRQADAPAKNSALDRLMRDFADMTATLTFLEDGLRAVVVIDRK